MGNTNAHPIVAVGTLNEHGRFIPEAVAVVRVLLIEERGEGEIVSTTIARSAEAHDGDDIIRFSLADTFGEVVQLLSKSPSAFLRSLAADTKGGSSDD